MKEPFFLRKKINEVFASVSNVDLGVTTLGESENDPLIDLLMWWISTKLAT